MIRRRKKKPVEATPVVSDGGAYRIKVELDRHSDWVGRIFDVNGNLVYTVQGGAYLGPAVQFRERALKAARRWVDTKIENERLIAEAKGLEHEEWYGQTPEVALRTIDVQKTYIEQLEASLDEFRRNDGSLDADALAEATQ